MNNKGTSMVELIVVIAVMAVIIGGIFIGLNLNNKADIKKVTKYIEQSLDQTRQKTMSIAAKEWNCVIAVEDDNYVVKVQKTTSNGEGDLVTSEDEKLGDNMKIYFKDENGPKRLIDSTSELVIGFDTSTGAYNNIELYNESAKTTTSSTGKIYVEIGDKIREINLYYSSGKYYTE